MRIGISCTSIEPMINQNKIDGIGTYTQNLYDNYLHRKQFLIPCSFSKNGLKHSHYHNGQIFSFSYIASTLLSVANNLPLTIHAALEKKMDVFHSTDHLIPQFKKIPIVATIHDAEMFQSHAWIKHRHLNRLKSYGRRLSLKWVKQFITISRAMIPELTNVCGIPEEKITVIYNGISSWWFEHVSMEEKEKLLAKFHLPEKFILFSGTLNYRKNVFRLVEAYLKLPSDLQREYPLIVVGKAGWDHSESAIALQKLHEAGAGRWLEYVSQAELRALFQNATLYAHPSLHEGFGLTLLQAFASCTPVLTSNLAAMPEIADGAAYLIDPYSVIDIQEGLKKILLDSALREQLIKKGTERVRHFSWEKCVTETLAVYERVI